MALFLGYFPAYRLLAAFRQLRQANRYRFAWRYLRARSGTLARTNPFAGAGSRQPEQQQDPARVQAINQIAPKCSNVLNYLNATATVDEDE